MTETVVTWGAIVVAIGLQLSILKMFGGYSDRLTKAETSAHAATILATALQVKIEGQQKELSDYKELAARMFVSDKDLFHAEQRFTGLVDEIKQDIRGVTMRLDRVLEERGHAQRS